MKRMLFIFLVMFGMTAVSFAGDYYGAIAINKQTGATGYSWDYSTRAYAETAALSECEGNCEIATWFRNTCGAVAYSKSKKTYGWAWGDYYESSAVKECGVNDCKVVASLCTSYDYWY